jgi:putative ABC transport system ATP-binding protein
MKGLALAARGIAKAYRIGKIRQQVLKNVDFDAYHGQMTMIMGPSGSGKSTLLATLSGLLRPDKGEVHALGENLWSQKPHKVDRFRLNNCGFIFQGFNLFPALDATAQVVQVLRYCGVGRRAAHVRATEVLEAVGLGQRLRQRPAELSGGENQRVAIARALAKQPVIILTDEPTGNLDSKSGAEVVALLHDLASDGATLVLITHDAGIAATFERRIQMRDGEIVADERR